jgi:hypothetical protein
MMRAHGRCSGDDGDDDDDGGQCLAVPRRHCREEWRCGPIISSSWPGCGWQMFNCRLCAATLRRVTVAEVMRADDDGGGGDDDNFRASPQGAPSDFPSSPCYHGQRGRVTSRGDQRRIRQDPGARERESQRPYVWTSTYSTGGLDESIMGFRYVRGLKELMDFVARVCYDPLAITAKSITTFREGAEVRLNRLPVSRASRGSRATMSRGSAEGPTRSREMCIFSTSSRLYYRTDSFNTQTRRTNKRNHIAAPKTRMHTLPHILPIL